MGTKYACDNSTNKTVSFQVEQFVNDLVVKATESCKPARKSHPRGCIKQLSKASLKRMMLRLRNCKASWQALVTLTYPETFPTDGKTVKKHLNAFAQEFRRKGSRWFWALEFQERGAPHIHIIVNQFIDIDKAKSRWFGIVGSGDEKHRNYGVQVEAARGQDGLGLVSYLFSYLKKGSQKVVPEGFQNVGRFWGGTREVAQAVTKIVMRVKDHDARRVLRTVRKWYEHKTKEWNLQRRRAADLALRPTPKWYRWKWRRGQGFIAWGGAAVFERLFDYELNLKFGGVNYV